jgi:hypothetical protein
MPASFDPLLFKHITIQATKTEDRRMCEICAVGQCTGVLCRAYSLALKKVLKKTLPNLKTNQKGFANSIMINKLSYQQLEEND